MATTTTTETEWIFKARARQILGCSQGNLNRMIADGRIGLREVPGSFARVNLDDVKAILAASTRPAIVGSRD
jgi:hypothetical protein